MPTEPPRTLIRATLLTALATVVATTVHHVFRLGPEMLVPGVVLLVLLTALMATFQRTGRSWAAWAFTAVNALVYVWFAVVDGFLDHVLKAIGLDNLTILPGGEAEVVGTFYSLWSPAAGNLLYEGTGVLTFVLGTLAVVLNVRLLGQLRTPRARRVATREEPAVATAR